jgi:hypothetical protein
VRRLLSSSSSLSLLLHAPHIIIHPALLCSKVNSVLFTEHNGLLLKLGVLLCTHRRRLRIPQALQLHLVLGLLGCG